jgi:hypothetical protein
MIAFYGFKYVLMTTKAMKFYIFGENIEYMEYTVVINFEIHIYLHYNEF